MQSTATSPTITSQKSTTCCLTSITNTCLKREWTRSVLEPVWVPVLEWRLISTTREISSPSYIFSMNLHISPGQPGWQRSVIPVGPHVRGVRIIFHSIFCQYEIPYSNFESDGSVLTWIWFSIKLRDVYCQQAEEIRSAQLHTSSLLASKTFCWLFSVYKMLLLITFPLCIQGE